jgi:GMP synthase (glutamine-hydrolysing)
MHAKRMAMRGVYKDILEREAHLFGADFIAQGTLYTDVSESGGGYDSGAKKHQIKQHHNVNLGFKVPELAPLSDQVKDGVRQIGKALGVPDAMLWRHPFPGPGLLVRIENKVKLWKLRVARQADVILVHELKAAGLYESVWQAGVVVTASRTTVTKGDGAGSGCVVALFAVSSVNGFTARPFHLPWEVLERISQRITNEIPEVGRVVYNLSGKPPATIEWG